MIPDIVAAALTVLLIGFLLSQIHTTDRKRWSYGAVTVTYEAPLSVQGTSTGPTAAQAGLINELSANVIAAADADTTATITHNMALSVAALALGHPWVILEPLVQATAALSLWAVTSKTTNTVVCTKATTASSGGAGAQLRVHVIRPWSAIGEFPSR